LTQEAPDRLAVETSLHRPPIDLEIHSAPIVRNDSSESGSHSFVEKHYPGERSNLPLSSGHRGH